MFSIIRKVGEKAYLTENEQKKKKRVIERFDIVL